MNFLLTIRYKDSWYALPPERRSEIVAATVAYHEKYLKSGKLKDTYSFVGGKLMSVWNVASFGEMVSVLGEHPYSFYVTYENEPFIDHQEAVKVIADRAKAAKKAAKK